LEGFDHQRSSQRILQLPASDALGTPIYFGSEIEPTFFLGRDISDVGSSNFIGTLRGLRELFKPIGSNWFSVSALRGLRPKAAFLSRLQSLSIHEPTDPILATMDALTPKHLLNAPRTIGLTTLQENKRDLLS
jgi:hypothetical protein